MSEIEIGYANAIIASAGLIAKGIQARALMVYREAVPDLEHLLKSIKPPTDIILITSKRDPNEDAIQDKRVHLLDVPDFRLTRMDQIKMATLVAFSQRVLNGGDTYVALAGMAGSPLDTMVVMEVGHEYELFQSVDQPKLTEHVRRVVFQRVLTIAMELANEGREGKPVGALFVIGPARELQKHTEQNIMNPFHGYSEKQRNILDDAMKNTVKEFSSIDGAFILKGNGVIVSAGTTLRPDIGGENLPQGLGARHASAAAITASTKSIAVTISESTGTVRLWRRGRMITEIEKAPKTPIPTPPPPPANGQP